MPLLNFSDLLPEVTLDDWKRTIVATATAVGLKTENWLPGGYTRTLVALFSRLYKTGSDVVRTIAMSGFLDTASGAWLKLLAKNLFGVTPIEATPAKAPLALRLTNAGGGVFFFEENDIVVAHATTHKTYRNKSAGTLNAFGTLDLDLEAEEVGSASNALVGSITVMVTSFGASVTCTNRLALAGLDDEKPEDLKNRCRDAIATLSIGGIKRAYEFYAKSATRAVDGSAIGINRARVMPPPGDGTLTVYVAGPSGAISGPDVADVQRIFDRTVTPYGFNATAVSAATLSVTVPLTIWIPSSLGLFDVDVQRFVTDALEAYISEVPIGGIIIAPATGKIFWRALEAVASRAITLKQGDAISYPTLKVELASEVDIAVAAGEVPIFTGVLADVTVVQVT